MALPTRKMDFNATLAKSDEKPQLEEIEMLPLVENSSHRMRFLSLAEAQPCFYYIQPQVAIPADTGKWTYQDNYQKLQPAVLGHSFLEGDLYLESPEGIYFKKNPETKIMISNATINICGIIEDWQSEKDCNETLICEVHCAAWKGTTKMIEVPVDQYKNVYRLIRKKYPDVSLATTGVDALEEYLTAVFQHRPDYLQPQIRSSMTGWMNIRGKISYYIGSDSYYKSVKLPDIAALDKLSLFSQGLSFLNVGRNNAAIAIIMLIAHMGYSLYWMREGQVDFRSVLYLKGKTNLLKTSVIREIANIFDINHDHSTMRVSSTLASLQYNVCMLRDNVICVDDFSNSESKSKSRSIEAVEDVIRAVGDGVFPTKMSMKGEVSVARNTVRAAVILTGEEELGLGLSSNLRTIVIPVTEGMFDGMALTVFQENRSIMRDYFALYVQFLTEYGERLSKDCRHAFAQYRAYYATKLDVPRFVDAAAGLRVQADFFDCFAGWCGLAEAERNTFTKLFEECILDTMLQNQKSSGGKQPEVKFLYGLMQSIGTTSNNNLADNEDIYSKNESKYIGFYEKEANLTWLRFEDAWRTVAAYYQNQGDDWLSKPQTIKELLLNNGISEGRKMPDNQAGTEYLRRARKGNRKRMLVLRQHVVEKLLKTE